MGTCWYFLTKLKGSTCSNWACRKASGCFIEVEWLISPTRDGGSSSIPRNRKWGKCHQGDIHDYFRDVFSRLTQGFADRLIVKALWRAQNFSSLRNGHINKATPDPLDLNFSRPFWSEILGGSDRWNWSFSLFAATMILRIRRMRTRSKWVESTLSLDRPRFCRAKKNDFVQSVTTWF